MRSKPRAPDIAEIRTCRRALGLHSTETVVHEAKIAVLDDIKTRLGPASRSEAGRVLIARTGASIFASADAAALPERIA